MSGTLKSKTHIEIKFSMFCTTQTLILDYIEICQGILGDSRICSKSIKRKILIQVLFKFFFFFLF